MPEPEVLGCCSEGHVTMPYFLGHNRYRCQRHPGGHCRGIVVLVRDHPAVRLVGYSYHYNEGWRDKDVFEMLIELGAWDDPRS